MQRTALYVAMVSALTIPVTASAVKYKLSGQVNRALVFMDDGQQSDVRNVDSDTSGTRWRLRGSEDLGSGMKVGFYYEMQTSSAPSSGARPDQNSDGDNGVSGGGNIRQANVWFSGSWGKVSMGQLDGAANGATEADLSGTVSSGVYSARASFTGGIAWRTSAGGTAAGLTAGSTFNNFDAFSRYDGIRYDSPALGPVVVSAGIGNDSKWEVAARVGSSIGGGQLSGALFYGEASGALNVDNRWGGSMSYLFSQGTNITAAYAQNEPQGTGGGDQDNWYIKLGHKWGQNAVAVSYGRTRDVGLVGNEDKGISIGYVYKLPKANAELYTSYMHQELDVSAATRATLAGGIEDIDVVVVGARVQFD